MFATVVQNIGVVILFLLIRLISCSETNNNEQQGANIIFITLDDVGYSDLGSMGAEWNTKNFDNFYKESISMTHHYNGYTDSASRSQIMTGLYSYHTGYGALGSSFGTSTIGGLPIKFGTMGEYLKYLGNYDTYYIGAWGLGHSVNEHTPNSRGFDYFYGTYTNDINVLTKRSKITYDTTDPSIIVNDDNEYFDFWENGNSVSITEATDRDSNTLYADKVVKVLHSKKKNSDNNNYFTFLSFQGLSQYKESGFRFKPSIAAQCSNYVDSDTNADRHYACQYMLHLDEQFGKILDAVLGDSNTLIVITSDNGGSLAYGSCNYPLRGGKASYYDGNARSVALIGGSIIADKLDNNEVNKELDGLMSNVDWLPTLLSYAGVLPTHWTKVKNMDGYNMYDYIMQSKGKSSSKPVRDHILLDIDMFGTEKYESENYNNKKGRQWAWSDDDINNRQKTSVTMTGLSMVFYDNEGHLYKYFVSNRNDETEDDDIEENYNWCVMDSNSDSVSLTSYNTGDLRPFSGLFDLTLDKSEQNNLLKSITVNDFNLLKDIVMEKADYYIDSDYSELSQYLYDSFDCFYDNYNILAYSASLKNENNEDKYGKWAQLFDSYDDYLNHFARECGFGSDTSHGLYTMHSSQLTEEENLIVEDNSDKTTLLNRRVPASSSKTDLASRQSKYSTVSQSSIEAALFGNKMSNNELVDSDNVYSSCVGLEDGKYYVQIDFDASKPVLTVQCSNGYMLIDYSNDNNWKDYFSSWTYFHWQVASPFKSDYADMTEWFVPDSGSGNYNYLLSYDCDVCDENSLYQTEGTSTTYWSSTVPNFCGSADKGVNAADEMWNYQCRNGVFSSGYGGAELIDIWHMTDENGIDRDLLLTKLSTTDTHLGICSSLKKAADYDNFDSQKDCAEGSGGELPNIGLKGQFCVCAKSESVSKSNSKRALDSATKAKLRASAQSSKTSDKVEANDNDNDKVFYLYASDFTSGTYRIQGKGTYILMDDIVFDYNAPDYTNDPDYSANSYDRSTMDLHWYPKQSQKEDYPGAYGFRDPYHLGFFAGITIEVDDVTLDLNDHTIEMDTRYYFQQPFWAHIQIGSNNFIPGKGPSPLGSDPKFVNNIVIKNGILGLTSHHCVHGTSPKHSEMTNIVIENLVCKEFTTHGIQLNGFNGLTLRNVEVGPTTDKHLLTSDYSNMRTLLPRFRFYADMYSEETFRFGGKPSKEYLIKNGIDLEQVSLTNDIDYTLADILDIAINQMDMAFDYVMGRKTEEELFAEYGLEWLQAKRVFVYEAQNGVPYGGSMYGVYLNYPGTGITGFYTNNEVSKNVEIDGLYIHDMQHGTLETPCITDHSKSPFGVAVSAQKMLGDPNYYSWADIDTIQDNGEMYYYGTIVYDMFLAFYDIVSRDPMNIDGLNMGVFETETLEWAKTGDYQTEQKWKVTCANDPMFHAVKGMYGLRISGVEGARVSNVKIENMVEMSDLGNDMCGSWVVFSQQQPYMYGYAGNNVHSISVLHSDVLFSNIDISNIASTTGNATAMTIYPRSSVKFEGDSNTIDNIVAGSQFQDANMNYNDLISELGEAQYPNSMPRACAIKTDDFGTPEALVSVNSLGEFDNTQLAVSCMSGYLDCDQTAVSSKAKWTDFGTYVKDISSKCNYDSNTLKYTHLSTDLNAPHPYSLSKLTIQVGMFIAVLAGLWMVCYYKVLSWSKLEGRWNGYQRL